MTKLLYVYQNYRRSYSSASLSILRGLKSMSSIEVESFELKPISFNNNITRILNRIPFIRKVHFNNQNKLLEKKNKDFHFDFIFIMKGTDLKAQTLKKIKKNNSSIKLICFNPDDPFNMASSNSEIISSIPLYDYYCIWTKLLNSKLIEAGAQKILYLPFAIDKKIIYPIESEYKFDISFVGNGDQERHTLISGLCDEIQRRKLDIKVHIFGSNWPSLGENVKIYGQRNGEELLKTIASTKINLNLLRKQNKNSINMRTFEIPAAKGFMLHEESKEASIFFKPNTEVVYFNSVTDLVDKCEYYLGNSSEREERINNCLDKIGLEKYSYEKVLEDCLSSIIKK